MKREGSSNRKAKSLEHEFKREPKPLPVVKEEPSRCSKAENLNLR